MWLFQLLRLLRLFMLTLPALRVSIRIRSGLIFASDVEPA